MSPSASPTRNAARRSCLACKRRKIKCNREQPCSYCNKLGLPCEYVQRSRGTDGQSNPEYLSRLKRVEDSLQSLQQTMSAVISRPRREADRTNIYNGPPSGGYVLPDARDTADTNTTPASAETRLIPSTLWKDPGEADNVNIETPDETLVDQGSVPSNGNQSQQHQAVVFSSFPNSIDLQGLHPAGSHIFALWQLFLENVDPVLKLIHAPLTQKHLLRASQNISQISPSFECLMFAIYYASISSMQGPAVKTNFQEGRRTLLDRYQFGMEQSLAKARFMSNPSIPTLQALTMYLVCGRRELDKTYIWSMTGLLVRLAMKLQLNRDPATLPVTPFIVELRRRLWWQIAVLDVRIAEENDLDPLIHEHMFDTRFPSNVNDSDLDSSMTSPVQQRRQFSEMTYPLVRIEATHTIRKLVFSPKFNEDNGYPDWTLQEKNDQVDFLLADFTDRYLQYCDEKIPICLLAVTSIRMILQKVKLTINHPARNGLASLTNIQRSDLTQSSIEILDYAHSLRTSNDCSRWFWLFQRYLEWDAVAFLLHSLSAPSSPKPYHRAWLVVDRFFDAWKDHTSNDDERWKRLETLRLRALANQGSERGLSSEHAAAPAAIRMIPGPSEDVTSSNPSHPPNSFAYQDLQRPQEDLQLEMDAFAEFDYQAWNFDPMPMNMLAASSWDLELDGELFTS